MAKKLTYLQNADGNRKWLLPAFSDDDHKSEDYVYLCQHSDGNKTELDIVKILKSKWDEIALEINEALKEFK